MENLTENTMNNYVANTIVAGVETEILIQNRSLLYCCEVIGIFDFFFETGTGFLIWNRISLCQKSFVMTPIDRVIRMDGNAWPEATVVVLMLPSAEVAFYL
eukprot:scaffold18616_cov49-Skeletonema_menzelii.AAC.1